MKAIVLMGVSGCGKSTVGKLLQSATNFLFFDGDDFHPEANIIKMRSGIPLTDADRSDWLLRIHILIHENLPRNDIIIACSALKESYRDILRQDHENSVKFIFLKGDYDQLLDRLKERTSHFFSPSLLQSQFDSLETPIDALTVSVMQSPESIVEIIMNELTIKSEIGVFGMGVMGKSFSRNLASRGFSISLYNRRVDNIEENVAEKFKLQFPEELVNSQAFEDINLFVQSLQKPRKIILLIEAGKVTDIVINALLSYLSPSDIIADFGNSHFEDTQRRAALLMKGDIHFIGCGISGGEEGALRGPSLMPSGNRQACKCLLPFLNAVAARDINDKPCCSYIGDHGSGHFVKMIHNGIEYAEMQLLAEVYQLGLASGRNPGEIVDLLQGWKDQTDMDSYLLEITIKILNTKEGDGWLIDKILDNAKSKGTGNWATVEITKQSIPSTMIASSLFARFISSYKNDRQELAGIYSCAKQLEIENRDNLDFLSGTDLLCAYTLARWVNHIQGFVAIKEISKIHNWDINLSELARVWTNGCIIRSKLMQLFVSILSEINETLTPHKPIHLLLNPAIAKIVMTTKPDLTKIVSKAILSDLSIPCFNEALNYINAMTRAQSTSNLIQAQRDFFGAHTFQRVDAPPEQSFHHIWS